MKRDIAHLREERRRQTVPRFGCDPQNERAVQALKPSVGQGVYSGHSAACVVADDCGGNFSMSYCWEASAYIFLYAITVMPLAPLFQRVKVELAIFASRQSAMAVQPFFRPKASNSVGVSIGVCMVRKIAHFGAYCKRNLAPGQNGWF
jgi:hypothetical protein